MERGEEGNREERGLVPSRARHFVRALLRRRAEWRQRGATSDVMGMSSNCWDA